jgi:hypothetical protein
MSVILKGQATPGWQVLRMHFVWQIKMGDAGVASFKNAFCLAN